MDSSNCSRQMTSTLPCLWANLWAPLPTSSAHNQIQWSRQAEGRPLEETGIQRVAQPRTTLLSPGSRTDHTGRSWTCLILEIQNRNGGGRLDSSQGLRCVYPSVGYRHPRGRTCLENSLPLAAGGKSWTVTSTGPCSLSGGGCF